MIHLDDEVVRELDEHRTRDYPYKSRGAVIRNALDEYLRRANKSPIPATAATAKTTPIMAKAPAPQDWR
jgi:metal-responsive CopG/Arc/MetJ family transcriptional regulator